MKSWLGCSIMLFAAPGFALGQLAGTGRLACPVAEAAGVAEAEPLASGGWTTGGAFAELRPIGIDARKSRRMVRHGGVDLAAPFGSAVTAVRSGRIVLASSGPHLGNTVIIEHPDRTYSVYAFLGALEVAESTTVGAGGKIGTVGFSGDAAAVRRARPNAGARVHFALISGKRSGLAGAGQPLRLLVAAADAWQFDALALATPIDPATRLPARCLKRRP
jgi:murein DD-endopeptidase MepM/ murein hydrolase activator NlpD